MNFDKRLGKKGVTEIIKLIDAGVSEEKVLEAFNPKPKLPDAPSKCPALKEQNVELRKKNKELEKEIKELIAFKDSTEILDQFVYNVTMLAKLMATIQRDVRYRKAFVKGMGQNTKNAMSFMDIGINEIDDLTMTELKKQYRKKAKIMHP